MDKDKWMVFNLSLFAEVVLTIFYLSAGLILALLLFKNSPVWYLWILPTIWSFYFLFKGAFIFTNRKNYIKIKGCQLIYCLDLNDESGFFNIDTYKIYSNSRLGADREWILELRGADNVKNELLINLTDVNLAGFKKAIEKCLKKGNVPQH